MKARPTQGVVLRFNVALNRRGNTVNIGACLSPHDFANGYAAAKNKPLYVINGGEEPLFQVGELEFLYFYKLGKSHESQDD